MKNIFLIILVLFLFLAFILTIYLIKYQTNFKSEANYIGSSKLPSITNSYVFTSPVRAKAGGDLIRLTVFLLDDEGNPIYDQKVDVQSASGIIEIKKIQELTDEVGKALFDISADLRGEYFISVFANGFPIPKNLRVVFD